MITLGTCVRSIESLNVRKELERAERDAKKIDSKYGQCYTYGFSPARSCQDAISAIFRALNLKNAFVLDADISGCFDNIDHQTLLNKLDIFTKLRQIIKEWLNAGIMEGETYHKPKAGRSDFYFAGKYCFTWNTA